MGVAWMQSSNIKIAKEIGQAHNHAIVPCTFVKRMLSSACRPEASIRVLLYIRRQPVDVSLLQGHRTKF